MDNIKCENQGNKEENKKEENKKEETKKEETKKEKQSGNEFRCYERHDYSIYCPRYYSEEEENDENFCGKNFNSNTDLEKHYNCECLFTIHRCTNCKSFHSKRFVQLTPEKCVFIDDKQPKLIGEQRSIGRPLRRSKKTEITYRYDSSDSKIWKGLSTQHL